MQDPNLENTGPLPLTNTVIEIDPRPGDYMAEGDTGIVYEIQQEDGDWTPHTFEDDEDYQWGQYFDACTCTNYGCKHSIEMQLNRMLRLGLFTADEIAKLTFHKFIVDGKFVRLSGRYNAIKSGTNGGQKSGPLGNYVYKPWDSVRHDGMVPESLCPFPRLQRTPAFTVEQYFDESVTLTPEVKAAAQAWLDIFLTKYEIVPTDPANMEKHKKQAPICIASKCCQPWDGSIIPSCGVGNGHCTAIYGSQPGVLWKDEDSYKPPHKRFAYDYGINYSVKGVIYLKRLTAPVMPPPPIAHQWTKAMHFGETSDDILKMQQLLQAKGYFKANVKPTGYYGLITAEAVLKLQQQYRVADGVSLRMWGGRNVASLTLPILNKLSI